MIINYFLNSLNSNFMILLEVNGNKIRKKLNVPTISLERSGFRQKPEEKKNLAVWEFGKFTVKF